MFYWTLRYMMNVNIHELGSNEELSFSNLSSSNLSLRNLLEKTNKLETEAKRIDKKLDSLSQGVLLKREVLDSITASLDAHHIALEQHKDDLRKFITLTNSVLHPQITEHLNKISTQISQVGIAKEQVGRMKQREEESLLEKHESKAIERIEQFNSELTKHVVTHLQSKIEELSRQLVQKKLSGTSTPDISKLETDLKHLTVLANSITQLSTPLLKQMQKEIQALKAKSKNFAHTYKALSEIAKKTLSEIQTKTLAKTEDVGKALFNLKPAIYKALNVEVEFAIPTIPKYKLGENNSKEILEFLKKESALALSSSDNPNWKKIEAKMVFADGSLGTSSLTPLSEVQSRSVGVTKPMLASGERGTAEAVVNPWISGYSCKDAAGNETASFEWNRSAVLAMDESHVELTDAEHTKADGTPITNKKELLELTHNKFKEINRAKVHQSLALEVDQQLNNKRFTSKTKDKINEYLDLIQHAAKDPDKKTKLDNEMAHGRIKRDASGVYSFPQLELKMDHTTVGLLTLVGKESSMWNAQEAAEESFNHQSTEFQLEIGDKEVPPVKVNIHCNWNMVAYNFGVAEIPHDIGGLAGMARDTLSGHTAINEEAFKKTTALYQNYLETTEKELTDLLQNQPLTKNESARQSLLKEDLENAQYLMGQIRDHDGVKNFKNFGNAYAIPARIVLLQEIMGGKGRIHCKSGKDRTSLMDIEIKYLAQQLENRRKTGQAREIPIYLKDESQEDRELRTQIALSGGNLVITEANTGESGIKTLDRSEAKAKFGEDIAAYLLGDSGLTKS